MAAGLCDVAFFFFITAILVHIFRQEQVSTDVIAGAIVDYLLMAAMWAQLYILLETAKPGSFHFPAGALDSIPAQLKYFSIVTITTVGYGDITPSAPASKALANLESIVGQLYLVILVAWLVGMHVTIKSRG